MGIGLGAKKEVLSLFPYLDGALRRDMPPVAAAVLADLGIVLRIRFPHVRWPDLPDGPAAGGPGARKPSRSCSPRSSSSNASLPLRSRPSWRRVGPRMA